MPLVEVIEPDQMKKKILKMKKKFCASNGNNLDKKKIWQMKNVSVDFDRKSIQQKRLLWQDKNIVIHKPQILSWLILDRKHNCTVAWDKGKGK